MPAPNAVPIRPGQTIALTAFALLAFAGNSILCRMALGDERIDPATFTSIRLVAGACALWAIHFSLHRRNRTQPSHHKRKGSWMSAAMLFLYAACFSFAYVSLDTGTGALILFGMVQITMLAAALFAGKHPRRIEWVGWGLAMLGLVYLLAPGVSAPPLLGAALMAVAGIAWGVYSLRGRSERDALTGTTFNFVRTIPLVLGLAIIGLAQPNVSAYGAMLALISGAVTSGIGYAVWYSALPALTTLQAAMVQLAVPIIAAVGGVLLLAEPLSLRLLVAGALVLGGIALSVNGATRPTGPRA